jgi:hypothetical protein
MLAILSRPVRLSLQVMCVLFSNKVNISIFYHVETVTFRDKAKNIQPKIE